MIALWTLMREAALMRHEILVAFWYPAGPTRVAATARHRDIVRNVYGR